MKIVKFRTFVIFALAALAGVALLHASQRVQKAEDELAALSLEIAKEEESIRILRAEWEYLNRPERLEKMAQEFLDLLPPAPDKMPDDMIDAVKTLPDRPQDAPPQSQPLETQAVSFGGVNGDIDDDIVDVPKPRIKPSVKPRGVSRSALPRAIEKPVLNRPQQSEPKEFNTLLKELGGGQ